MDNVEKVQLNIANDDPPVVIHGNGAGFVHNLLRTSHQSTKNIACTQSIHGIEALSTDDRLKMAAAMDAAYAAHYPVNLPLNRLGLKEMHPGGLLGVRGGRGRSKSASMQ